MAMFKKPRIGYPLTPLDIKGINDFFSVVMYKIAGNINFADMSPEVTQKIDTVVEKTDINTVTIQETIVDVFGKASQTDLDATNGRVSTAETTIVNQGTTITNQGTTITNHGSAIALKADQTSLNTTNSNLTALDTRVSSAELKITPTAIVSTVTSSTSYTNTINGLDTRLDSAESKITATAIVNTVRTSTSYINDLGAKITSAQASTIAQTASNVQIGFNGICDVIDMDSTGLQVNHTDGSYTKLRAGGIQRHIGSTDKDYHYLMATGSAQTPGTPTAYWVDLPSEFDGKGYSVSLSMKSTVGNQYPLSDHISDIVLYVSNYGSGGFNVVGYWNASSGTGIDDKPMEFSWVAIA